MDVFEAIHGRRSVREFIRDKPVEEEKLQKILEACLAAPSAHNEEPWEFVVIRNKEALGEIAKQAANGQFLGKVPLAVAIITDPKASPNYHMVDGALLTQNFALAAYALGLGTCWVGSSLNRDKVKELLHIPKEKNLLTILPLGYPKGKAPTPVRKSLKELVHYDKYQ
jgi:nitroreductase